MWWTIQKRSTVCCCFHLRNVSSSYHGQGHPCFYLFSLRALHRSSPLTPSKVTQDAEDSCSRAQNFSWARTEERREDVEGDFRREEGGGGGDEGLTGEERSEKTCMLVEVIEIIERPGDPNRRLYMSWTLSRKLTHMEGWKQREQMEISSSVERERQNKMKEATWTQRREGEKV